MHLPRQSGTYLLIQALEQSQTIQVGHLGCFDFVPGYYAYTGSAFGPGGLAARIGRHQNPEAGCHWHIDYFLRKSIRVGGYFSTEKTPLECTWAKACSLLLGASIPVKGFGSSDCRNQCRSHFIYLGKHLRLADLQSILGNHVEPINLPGDGLDFIDLG